MITLAVASRRAVLASQMSDSHRRRGRPVVSAPAAAATGFRATLQSRFSDRRNGRILAYYLVFFSALLLFLVLLRIVNSPFGRVLQAIRENEFRAEALGYRVVAYRTAASVIWRSPPPSRARMLALWLRYDGPDTTLSFSIMIDILLMVVIGGMGTMYGAVIGAASSCWRRATFNSSWGRPAAA